MQLNLKAVRIRAFKLKHIYIIVLTATLLVIATIVIFSHSNDLLLKNKYQNEICGMLYSIQIEIKAAVQNNNRKDISTIALRYERLGTMYANVSSQLFDSYFDTGAWGTAARILVGNHLSYTLFQAYDGQLTEEEVVFLNQLSDMNKDLLLDIADDTSPQGVRNMSIKTLKEILNHYHIITLREFLKSWESS